MLCSFFDESNLCSLWYNLATAPNGLKHVNFGSIYGYLYQGTGNIGECLAFGRVSGRNAAAEAPWD
jgi:hypothetical protein